MVGIVVKLHLSSVKSLVMKIPTLGPFVYKQSSENNKKSQTGKIEAIGIGYIDHVVADNGYANVSTITTPISQFSPSLLNKSLIMMDLLSHSNFSKDMAVSMKYSETVMSEPLDLSFLLDHILLQTNYSKDTK